MNTGPGELDVVASDVESELEAQAPAAEPALEALPPAPVLVTVHEVAFSTAAAVPVRRSALRRWADAASVVLTAVHRTVLVSEANPRAPRHDQPRNYGFVEEGRMGREMDRL